MHHAWEGFYYAVRYLVWAPGDIRARLKGAYRDNLMGLVREELPADLHKDYDWIMQMLKREKPFRNKTGSKIAQRIFSVWESLEIKRQDDSVP